MVASFVGSTIAGAGQSAVTNTLATSLPPGWTAGDVSLLFIESDGNPTLNVVSGWTQVGTIDAATNARTWVFSRQHQAGDTAPTLTLTTTARWAAHLDTFRGVTLTGLLQDANSTSGATGTYTLPTLAGVPAGAMLVAAHLRRRSGASGNITVAAPYTETQDVTTSYGSGVNIFGTTGYAVDADGGAAGGESATSGVTSIGANWLVALPAAAATNLNRLKLGASTIDALRLGSSTVSKVYQGSTQVWP